MLEVNDQLKIDITLEVGSVQQEVNVTANAVQGGNRQHPSLAM